MRLRVYDEERHGQTLEQPYQAMCIQGIRFESDSQQSLLIIECLQCDSATLVTAVLVSIHDSPRFSTKSHKQRHGQRMFLASTGYLK
jgi:hypothetical protein